MCFYQVVQLEELMSVRHSVFVVGNAGTGKSQVWLFFIIVLKGTGFRNILSFTFKDAGEHMVDFAKLKLFKLDSILN